MSNNHKPNCRCVDCIPANSWGKSVEDANVGDNITFRFECEGIKTFRKAEIVGKVDSDHVKVLEPGYRTTKVVGGSDILK